MTQYEPPKQGLRGQLLDAFIILALLFATLFLTTYVIERQTESETTGTETSETKPLSELALSSAEKQQFQKMINAGIIDLQATNEVVKTNQPTTDKYNFSAISLIATIGIIVLYLAFVYWVSLREYKEVIREKFDSSEVQRT
ncbi:conserved hypothetical protein [Rubrobacter xylanophilus DSM 9941]|uniref:Uncharacterized protein n=1 Tax=Rubrobacter xylanophilus (strain DSM 9941 / JCM 11954 / NBRC 16129 / PRD-1) TaxID=266117 RepID=Q1AT35_RUBXD|nr:hypothetical protein [Rubrobacter xylanophilus]ABG05443.1 conserved hypothetical protein [Rubrobacter xylanophilus DSM 9941]